MTALADFDYSLPAGLIAQTPLKERSESRLLVLDRKGGRIDHRRFIDLPDYLKTGDCLVANETKVIPARLLGHKLSGASVEVLLLSEVTGDTWEALCRPARRLPTGSRLVFDDGLTAEIVEAREAGVRVVKFFAQGSVPAALFRAGRMALPPYIHEPLIEPDRYQTIFAAASGSVAAPTAGLHFTGPFLSKLEASGVRVAKLTLDIGLDTFRPIQTERIEDHRMHSEAYDLPAAAAAAITGTKSAGGRILAVGTTTVRALESAASPSGAVEPGRRRTDIFIRPGFKFQVADLILTNFHLPKSTLLVMISAFAGRENVLRAYGEAVERGYRFYSFGDAMLII